MIPPGSRYEDAVTSFATSHVYDKYGRLILESDNAVPLPKVATHQTTYRLTIPNGDPPPPLEYFVNDGETMPYLAWKLTRRHANWWQIAEANPHIWYPLDLPTGSSLRIPV